MPGKNKSEDYDDPGKILAAIISAYGESILENPQLFLDEFNKLRKSNCLAYAIRQTKSVD